MLFSYDPDGETEGRDSSVDLGSEGDQKPGVGFFFKVKAGGIHVPRWPGHHPPWPCGAAAAEARGASVFKPNASTVCVQ